MPFEKPKIDETKLLICTMGLPRSGKSTWAKSQPYPIVNRDAIRIAIHNQRFVFAAEPLVKMHALYMVKSLFLAGHDIVVLDETCTTRARREHWRSAGNWTTMFKPICTTLELCLVRAVGDPEIQRVIHKMAESWEELGVDEPEFTELP